MKTTATILIGTLAAVLLVTAGTALSQETAPPPTSSAAAPSESADAPKNDENISSVDLGGTSWQLVKFQGGDDTVLMPDDKTKYTIAFAADGGVSVRFDCNRGHGTWKSVAAKQIEFDPLALTRAMCPPGSLHDQIVKQWGFVRSYMIKEGRLFLSLMADGGIYEFEPIPGKR